MRLAILSRARNLRWPLLLALAGMLFYAPLLAPTVTGADAGELILAAWSRGVAHAPGFPTWLLLASAFVRLPLAAPAWRLNAFSALAAALALPFIWLWLRQLPRPARERATGGRPHGRRQSPATAPFLPGLWALAATLCFALGRSFWPWATTSEVYTLNLLLVAASLYFLFRWSGSAAAPSPLPLFAAAFTYGLALGAHLATTALLAPAIAFWLFRHRGRLTLPHFLAAAAALALGFSVYLLLPLRAAADPTLNWGDPDTLHRFWRHLTAAQYRSNLNLAPGSLLAELRFGLGLSLWQYSPLGFALILWGLARGWREKRALTAFVLIGVAASMAYAIAYAIEDDQDAYYILAHLLLLVPLLWGLRLAAARLARWGPRAPLLLALVPLLTGLVNFRVADRAGYWYHHDYYHNLVAAVGENGTIITRDWQFYSPSLYYQRVLGDRPDLHIIDAELMRRDWYLDHLQRWYPELTGPAAAELDTYRALRDAWEAAPAAFEREPGRVLALQQAYIGAINALIAAAARLGPVHLGPDQEEGVAAGYTWLPTGLSFRLLPAGTPPPLPPPLAWDTSHLAGQWPRLPDEPARKVARAHALMLQNRALYLARLGEAGLARAALDLAERIAPGDPFTASLRLQLGLAE